MKLHLQYLYYIIRHKWFVFVECCKLGIPWLGVIHDLSRFRPSEALGYIASQPYNKENKPLAIARSFTYAWNDHQHRNKHHWEYWVHFDYHTHEEKVLQIPDIYRREMLADWRGAARARGDTGTAAEWWRRNQKVIKLHPYTKVWVSENIHYCYHWPARLCKLGNLADFRYWFCECHYKVPFGKVISGDCPKHD